MDGQYPEDCPGKLGRLSLAGHGHIGIAQMLVGYRVTVQASGLRDRISVMTKEVVLLDSSWSDNRRISAPAVDAADLVGPKFFG